MSSDEKLDAAMKEIEADVKPGAASVKLGEDGILKVVIDLNVTQDLFIETRVGAYGALQWAQELSSRWIMAKEMKLVRDRALEAQQKGIVVPGQGVIDISQMKGPK